MLYILLIYRMGNIKKVRTHECHAPEESTEEMDVENPNEIDYTLTNNQDIVINVIVIKQVNIGNDPRLIVIKIKVDVEVEIKPVVIKKLRIGPKKIEFQLELRTWFETQQELNEIDTMGENITCMVYQNAS